MVLPSRLISFLHTLFGVHPAFSGQHSGQALVVKVDCHRDRSSGPEAIDCNLTQPAKGGAHRQLERRTLSTWPRTWAVTVAHSTAYHR